ncbi:MAG TPA: RluA family pseudouridine synthase [Lacunisphaera sp.]|nr:RluA family pseudouridine synthase [Lacunisphaera sp.]
MPALPPVIFEDESLVAFDKPAGMAVAAERGQAPGAHLMHAVQERMGRDVTLVHRIDTEASGLVLCAKTKAALDFLSGQFQAKTVIKRYEALTAGIPARVEFTVDLVLKEDEARPGVMCVVKKHGQGSVTEFSVREKFPQPPGRPGVALVECRPLTGRPHQVRLHLAVSGAPVLNDALYGTDARLLLSDLKRGYKGRDDERPLISRLALHAAALTFTHPLSREKTTLEAPRPKDFAVALKYLQKFAPR